LQKVALGEPLQGLGGAFRHDVLKVIQRVEKRALDVPLYVTRPAREAARHSFQNHPPHALLRDCGRKRLAVVR